MTQTAQQNTQFKYTRRKRARYVRANSRGYFFNKNGTANHKELFGTLSVKECMEKRYSIPFKGENKIQMKSAVNGIMITSRWLALTKKSWTAYECLPSPLNHTIRAVLLLHGLQQQQQQQQKKPVMIDSTSNRNTNTSTMRTAVLRASHQRTKPAGKSYTVAIFR